MKSKFCNYLHNYKKAYQNPIETMQDLKINANGSKQKNAYIKSKRLHLNHVSHI